MTPTSIDILKDPQVRAAVRKLIDVVKEKDGQVFIGLVLPDETNHLCFSYGRASTLDFLALCFDKAIYAEGCGEEEAAR